MTNFILCFCISLSVKEFFIDLFQNLVAGVILLLLGSILYKRIKKKQTVDDIKVDIDFKIANIVASFKRYQKKYSKPLTKESFSTEEENDVTKIYDLCEEVRNLYSYFHIEPDGDIQILTKVCLNIKNVLHLNEKYKIDENNNYIIIEPQPEDEFMKYRKQRMIDFYLEEYTIFNSALEERIKKGEFLKKHWNK